ncbi:terminase large subunit [Dysgonomonas sp. GY617]|uniref:terminase large subunit n=1 Tax=Dysgonomonas sp. GY617 TaxID=2780420 RepID=UPI0018847056|nr:terminase TerL endonuclease subunit [Dysgonomonas sp. GY617]MBF0577731.1 terminase large subunit [Dysgonomonas sp. GY617]
MNIDKQELRDLKLKVSGELKDIDVLSYRLKDTDERLNTYVFSVINNPEAHNIYEQLSIKRFFQFLDKYEFRSVEVKKFVVFYEKLKFTGAKGLTRYKLTPVQTFQIANIFAFYKENGKRVTRDVLLFVPRKFSKTTFVAAIAIYDLLFGDRNAQAYVAANSYKQAQICFKIIKEILKAHDRKLRHFKINREVVHNLRRGQPSFAECLASAADTLDGLMASLVLVDEYSQADSAELKNVLTSSMGTRENPLTIIITTASEKLNSPCVELLTAYKTILRGELDNDAVFAHIFEPDVDDAEDDPATWKKVQPHFGITVQSDYYEEEWKKAQLTSDDMLTFRTKLLNIFVQNTAKQWFSQDEISALARNITIDSIDKKYPCMVSVDLSVFDDFSTVTYTIHNEDSRSFFSHNEFYLPEVTIENHPNKELYKKWVKEGHLKVIKGNVIDYKLIANDIMKRGSHLRILKIGYDPYKAATFVNTVIALGGKENIEPVSQTYGSFTSPVESIEYAIKTSSIIFNNNPIIWYCFGNAMIDEDRLGNRKPIKKAENDKIDCTITNTMNFHLFNNYVR